MIVPNLLDTLGKPIDNLERNNNEPKNIHGQ